MNHPGAPEIPSPLRASAPHVRRAERITSVVRETINKGLPVVAGPWTGEVGFELLYWAPFVRWVAATYQVPREQLVILSRGGTASWYGEISARYADVFSCVSAEELRARNVSVKMKQSANYDTFTQELLTRASALLNLSGVSQLHPHLMYRLMRPYWDRIVPVTYVMGFASYSVITPPHDEVVNDLPPDYVAVRFYSSKFFPDTAANRRFVQDTIEAIALRVPVVLLTQPFDVDDHRDILDGSARILTVRGATSPSTNLALQTAVIGRARAFVGTYGGLSYLAPYCGVRSFAVYSDAGWKRSHLDIAHQVFGYLNVPPLTVLGPGTSAIDVAEHVQASLAA